MTSSFLIFGSLVLSSAFLIAVRSPPSAPLSESSLPSGRLTHSILSLLWLVLQSWPSLCDPMNRSPPPPLSMRFSWHENWSGQWFPSPGDLPNPGTEPRSSAWTGGFFFFFPYCWATREALVWSFIFSKYLGDYGLVKNWKSLLIARL